MQTFQKPPVCLLWTAAAGTGLRRCKTPSVLNSSLTPFPLVPSPFLLYFPFSLSELLESWCEQKLISIFLLTLEVNQICREVLENIIDLIERGPVGEKGLNQEQCYQLPRVHQTRLLIAKGGCRAALPEPPLSDFEVLGGRF